MTGRGAVPGTLRQAAAALLLLACGFTDTACSNLPFGRGAEPSVIAVRNRSSEDISTVTLREAGRSADRAGRYGSLSPVPAGVTQSYRRPRGAASFPGTMTVEWTDSDGRMRSHDVKVSGALRSATGAAGEALVFEFGPFENVNVFVEDMERRMSSMSDTGQDLEGGPWLLRELNGAPVQLPAGERQPYLLFQRQDRRVTGYSGCNDFFGGYDRRGEVLVFGPLGMTRRFCADAAGEVEQAFLGVLSKTRTCRVEQQMLLLLDGNRVLARLRQEPMSIQQ